MRWNVLAVLAALLAAPLVMAEDAGVVADIPFPFIVSGKTHAAGEWTLIKVGSGAAHIWLLKDSALKNVQLLAANSSYKRFDEQTRLTFNRYGETYFLSEISLPGGSAYYLWPSRAEKALRVAGVKPEKTVMFARLR